MKLKWHKSGVLLWMMWGVWLFSQPAYGMKSEAFSVWTGVRVNRQISPHVGVRGTFQLRTQHGLEEMERERLNVGMDFRVLSWLQLKGGYEIQYRESDGWKVAHRYQTGFMMSVPGRKLKVSWQELFQQTFVGGTGDSQLRSRLKAACEPKEWDIWPYVSVESFQPVGEKDFFFLSRVRCLSGVRWVFSHKMALDAFYGRQYDVKSRLNIWGINLEIKL